jgi:hypothetical protein
MENYIARLVFEIKNQSKFRQFDEQLRWIEATDFNDALEKALLLGSSETDEFLSIDSSKVLWEFIAVTALMDIKSLSHGSEILYCIKEESEAESYVKTMRLKQNALSLQAEIV